MLFYSATLLLHVIMIICVSICLYIRIRHEYVYGKLINYQEQISSKYLQEYRDMIPTINTPEKFIEWQINLSINSCITHPTNLFKPYKVILSKWWIWDHTQFILNRE